MENIIIFCVYHKMFNKHSNDINCEYKYYGVNEIYQKNKK
jgi:hypothetical protein